jgi:hypothetical protein
MIVPKLMPSLAMSLPIIVDVLEMHNANDYEIVDNNMYHVNIENNTNDSILVKISSLQESLTVLDLIIDIEKQYNRNRCLPRRYPR